ncbi:hypothetical protein DFJ74DRAFT_660506 [Hyaloraphidium curvatum]|nr:hypothetical protein DFJ74DRAFT_660501 [Hyaloraphidium curvatum]KAI9027806.1 hypothetical protein DFJ74DRAFT_660506 [Hyaloraphidium curvatum]
MRGANPTGVPVYEGALAGSPIPVTLANVPETLVGWAPGAKTTTLEAVYRAGEMRTLAISTVVAGKSTGTSTKTVTVATGKMVTTRRTFTTSLNNAVDGCLPTLVDGSNWVVPTVKVAKDAIVQLGGVVDGTPILGVAMMKEAFTKVVPPYPTDRPLPPKPTSIVPTSCGRFNAYATPTAVTPGQVMTLVLSNVPATPVGLLEKGYSTVYEARYAATILSDYVSVSAIPTRTYTTTLRTNACINFTATITAGAATRFLPLTAAPSPTRVYQVRMAARNYSDQPDVPPPAEYREADDVRTFYLSAGPNTPPTVIAGKFPCLAGPLRTRTRITFDAAAWASRFYRYNRTTSRGVTTHRLSIRLGSRNAFSFGFVARDYDRGRGRMDLYAANAAGFQRPQDWAFEWQPTGVFTGRTMPPFTVTTTYLADNLMYPNGTLLRTPRAQIRAEHSVVVRPYWSATPKGGRPTIFANVTAKTYGTSDNVTLACAHPGAKRSAFMVLPMAVLGRQMTQADFSRESVTTRWSFVGPIALLSAPLADPARMQTTDKAGRWVPPHRPVLFTKNFGPLAEMDLRYASDGEGRSGEGNPNAPEGSPDREGLRKMLERFRQV